MLTDVDFLEMHIIDKLKWLRDNTTIETLTYFYTKHGTTDAICLDIGLKALIDLLDKFSIDNTFIIEYSLTKFEHDDVTEASPEMRSVVEMLEELKSLALSEDQNEKIFYHISITWAREDSAEARLEESIEVALMSHIEKMLWRMKENVGISLKI